MTWAPYFAVYCLCMSDARTYYVGLAQAGSNYNSFTLGPSIAMAVDLPKIKGITVNYDLGTVVFYYSVLI